MGRTPLILASPAFMPDVPYAQLLKDTFGPTQAAIEGADKRDGLTYAPESMSQITACLRKALAAPAMVTWVPDALRAAATIDAYVCDGRGGSWAMVLAAAVSQLPETRA
jgi:hypothetical protein